MSNEGPQMVVIPPEAFADRFNYTSGHIGLVVESEEQRKQLEEAIVDDG